MFSASKTAASSAAYQISRSLRFNSADSAYLNRTLSSGTTTTWTFSAWIKRGLISGPDADGRCFFGRITAQLCFTGGDIIRLNSDSGYIDWRTTAVFRDPTAWYHIVVVWDSNNGTAGDRLRLYINGALNTSWSLQIGTVSLGSSYGINEAAVHNIGRNVAAAGRYTDGYMTEINFIDGQALTPSSFGQTNSTTGAWDPKAYSGTYGTNGFYLNFSNNTGTTSTTLGKDYSGNGNNWTPNNFSVTAGAGNDSLTDTPTNYGTDTGAGGEARGNFCVLNGLDTDNGPTISDGNLKFVGSNSGAQARGTFPFDINDGVGLYFEVRWTAGSQNANIGISSCSDPISTLFYNAAGGYLYASSDGNKRNNGSSTAYGNSYAVNDYIGVATKNGKVWFSKNGTWQASGDPAAGTNAAFTGLTGLFSIAVMDNNTNAPCTFEINTGQRAFNTAAPTGFKSLCTQNIAAGSITTSGTFNGNANANGPVVYLNGVPTTMTINGNAVTFGTHADKLAVGFKLRTSSASYNASGSNSYSVSATDTKFKYSRAQANP